MIGKSIGERDLALRRIYNITTEYMHGDCADGIVLNEIKQILKRLEQ